MQHLKTAREHEAKRWVHGFDPSRYTFTIEEITSPHCERLSSTWTLTSHRCPHLAVLGDEKGSWLDMQRLVTVPGRHGAVRGTDGVENSDPHVSWSPGVS